MDSFKIDWDKLGCVVRMVVDSILPHAAWAMRKAGQMTIGKTHPVSPNPQIEMRSTFWLWRSIQRDSQRAKRWFRSKEHSVLKYFYLFYLQMCVHTNMKTLAQYKSTKTHLFSSNLGLKEFESDVDLALQCPCYVIIT